MKFPVGFEWDLAKNETNKTKHGINFNEAVSIFAGQLLERSALHLPSNEERVIATGKLGNRYVTVIYTWRAGVRRLISARKARDNEREAYERFIGYNA